MVSAAKFKKAQEDVEHVRVFVNRLNDIVNYLGNSISDVEVKFAGFRVSAKGKILVVPIASNKGLAGAFNSNVIKETERLLRDELRVEYKNGEVDILPIGKQLTKTFASRGIPMIGNYNGLLDSKTQNEVYNVAEQMIDDFFSGKYRQIVIVYNKFQNAAVQDVTSQQLLPLVLSTSQESSPYHDYIIEPDQATVLSELVPQAIKAMFYATMLESAASEHGARMTSMQKASDNANELLGELQLQYNKARQSAITNELIEIVSGAEALKQ